MYNALDHAAGDLRGSGRPVATTGQPWYILRPGCTLGVVQRSDPHRCFAVAMLLIVAVIVLLTPDASARMTPTKSQHAPEVCADARCELPVPDYDGCLHDHTCGSGVASAHADHAHGITTDVASLVSTGTPTRHLPASKSPPTILIVGGIERPPRFAS